jgi:hypothetical protein
MRRSLQLLTVIVFSLSLNSNAAHLKRKADDCPEERKKARAEVKLPSVVDPSLLKDGFLIPRASWDEVQKLPKLNDDEYIFEDDEDNPFGVAILMSGSRRYFAVAPIVLGEGKHSRVMLAQELCDKGTWVAIKFQSAEFEVDEIEFLRRHPSQLVDEPQRLRGRDDEGMYVWYVCLIKLVDGISLRKWLRIHDPKKALTLADFTNIQMKIYDALHEQIHERFTAYHDANLANIMVKNKNGKYVFIDFSNVVLSDRDNAESDEFTALRNYDYILMDSAIFMFLDSRDYQSDLQNRFWATMFLEARKSFEVHVTQTDRNSPFYAKNSQDCYGLLHQITMSHPPFLIEHYGEDGPTMEFRDDEISKLIGNLGLKQ